MNISNEQILNKAINLHIQGDIQEAYKFYSYLINQGFEDHNLFSNYGAILQSIGKSKDAEISYRKAIELNPDFADAYSNLGNLLRDLGNLRESEFYIRNAIELNPNFANAHLNLGNLLRDLSDLKEAEIAFRKAIELNPNLAEAYSNLGSILTDLGDLQKAEHYLRKAIKLRPDFAVAHSNLGGTLKALGKLKEAEFYVRRAIELNPNIAQSYTNLGTIMEKLDKFKEAELSYRKAIELNPNYAIANSNLGGILRYLGKLKEAEFYVRKAIQLNPNIPEPHYNLGLILNGVWKSQEAELSLRKAIELNPNLAEAYSLLGGILQIIGKLKEAELSLLKAIKLNPKLAEAHSNLGNLLIDLGNLQKAEFSLLKAIELNPNLASAHFTLSTLKNSNKNISWKNLLFAESILKNESQENQIHIFFARANILHREKNYVESSKYLKLANQSKLSLRPSIPDKEINKSKVLMDESYEKATNNKVNEEHPQSIFIVGMPRSGSTLLESIITMRDEVFDLGEINIFEESFLNWKKFDKRFNLAELYRKETNSRGSLKASTNKWLSNYQYAGIIANQIPNAKIIHCFRNPLDNILSIYRANFTVGNEYSSSVVDCATIYLNQDEIMSNYKSRFRSKIYDLNYDLLVNDPKEEIKSLISWLGWEWEDRYLSPHLNPRTVSTASHVQVRSPINSKSVGGWKNYKMMLQPAIQILNMSDKFSNLT
tara:strand:- start:281 stop:2419 length:2139 start_codon:yes stop_codon:yes gene_type:complete